MYQAWLGSVFDRYRRDPGQIIAILHELQDRERYLPEEDLRFVAGEHAIPESQLFHISTFYKAFSLKPRGKHQCNVCLGTACHVRGAPLLLEELERKLRVKAGESTGDMEFSLDTVNCVGACALAPIVMVDGEYYGNMQASQMGKLIERIRTGAPLPARRARAKPAVALQESLGRKLAEERGVFPNHLGSRYDRPGGERLRNATVTTVAPTGSISIIAGCSSGIEPLFALSFTRHVLGDAGLPEISGRFLEVAKERGFLTGDVLARVTSGAPLQEIPGVPDDVNRTFVTGFDISPEWHVRMQAAFQLHTDNAVSKTINFPPQATIDDVRRAFLLAYRRE